MNHAMFLQTEVVSFHLLALKVLGVNLAQPKTVHATQHVFILYVS